MLIEAALSDGRWLLFRSDWEAPPVDPVATKFLRVTLAAWLTLSILAGILLSMLAAHARQTAFRTRNSCGANWRLRLCFGDPPARIAGGARDD